MSIVVSVAIVIIFQKTLYFTFLSLPKNWRISHFIPVRIKIASEILWSYFSNNTRCDTLTLSLFMILINAFKLIGLVGPNINISYCNIQLDNFLPAKTYEKCIFSHFCEKLLNLINGAVTYICDCIYINLYMVFIT